MAWASVEQLQCCPEDTQNGTKHHQSRASFRFPQWGTLRDELNTRSTLRLSARMKPMRANIVGRRVSRPGSTKVAPAQH
jgi:hypothetical protein